MGIEVWLTGAGLVTLPFFFWDRWVPPLRRRWRRRWLRTGHLINRVTVGEMREVTEKYGVGALHPEYQQQLAKMMEMMDIVRRSSSTRPKP